MCARRGTWGRVWIVALAWVFWLAAGADAEAATRPADIALGVNSAGPAVAGEDARFDIAVANFGGEATGSPVKVTFYAEGGVRSSLSASGDGWTCNQAECTHGSSIAPGDHLPPIRVLVPVIAQRTTGYNSDGRVLLRAYTSGDGVPGNNDAYASSSIQAGSFADASIAVKPPADPPVRGNPAQFQALVSNVGSGKLDSRIEVNFSSSISGSGSGWTCPSGSGSCVTDTDLLTGADLPPITLSVRTTAGSGEANSSVSARLSIPGDSIGANDSGSAQTPLIGNVGPDLVTTLNPGPTALQGTQARATVSVANAGRAASSGNIEVSFGQSDVIASGSGWTCPAGAARCVTSAVAAPGASLPAIEVWAPTGLSSTKYLSASVSGGGDGIADNNQSSTVLPLSRPGDAVDVLATGTSTYDPSTGTASWTVDVSNAGSGESGGDTQVNFDSPSIYALAGGSTYRQFELVGDGWVCTDGKCVYPDPLPAGGSLPPITQKVTVPSSHRSASFSFSGSVSSESDGFTSNNQISSSFSTGGAGPDLAVTVAADRAVGVGETANGTVQVRNLGGAPADGPVQVSISSGGSPTSISGEGWKCGDDLICSHQGPVESGAALPALRVSSPATARQVGNRSFSATVSHPGDEVPNNNSGSSSFGIGGVLDDLIPVLDAAAPWQTGSPGRWTVTVANVGTEPRNGPVTVRVSAPYLTVVRGEGWICSAYLECTYSGGIAPGSSAPAMELISPIGQTQGSTVFGVSASLVTVDDDHPFNDSVSSNVPIVETSQPGALQMEFTRNRSGDVVPGQPEQVKLQVRNGSSSDMAGPFSVRLTPSRSVAIESVTGSGWTCDATLLCRRTLSVHAGESAPLDLTLRTSASASDVESVLATARWGTQASASAALRLPLSAVSGVDLLQEVEATAPTRAGSSSEFVVRVRNQGEVSERGKVEVRLSATGYSSGPVTAGGTGWSCPRESDRCVTDADVPPGGKLPDLSVYVPNQNGNPGGYVSLSSYLEGISDDAYPSNNTGQARSPIVGRSGVDLTATVDVDPYLRSDSTAKSTLTVKNLGSETATGRVVLRYNVYGSVETEVQASGDGWICANYRCLHSGPVAPDATLPPVVLSHKTYRSRYGSSSYSRVEVSATVEHPDDAVRQNDGTSTVAPVLARNGIDLAVGLRPLGETMRLREKARFAATVVNLGAQTATSRIEVTKPRDWTASGDGWVCPRGAVTCVTDTDLAPGDELPDLTLTDPALPGDPGQRSVGVSVQIDQDSEPDNNYSSVAVPLAPSGGPDLVARIDRGEAFAAGSPASFTATVVNVGGEPTSGPTTVKVQNPNAAGSGAGWSCTDNECTSNAVAGPEEALPPLTITRPTGANDGSTGVSVSVQSAADSSLANNDAGLDVALRRAAVTGPDLRAEGTLTGSSRPGSHDVWSFTAVNDGDAATGGPVAVTLQRPYGYTPYGHSLTAVASGDGWDCDASLRCSHAPLGAGESAAPIELAFDLPASDTLGSLALSGNVSGNGEAFPSNNSISTTYGTGGTLRDLVVSLESPPGVRSDQGFTQTVRVKSVASETVPGPIKATVSLPTSSSKIIGGSGWTCETSYQCSHDGPLPAGEELPALTIDTPAIAADGSRTLSTYVDIDAAADQILTDNRASSSIGRGMPLVDLAPEVTALGPARQGQNLLFDVEVRNGGSRASAKPWSLSISAPQGATAQGDGWICTSSLSCATETAVPAGGTLHPLRVTVPAAAKDNLGPQGVYAYIEQGDDQFTSNNSGSATVAVGGTAGDLTALVRPLGRWRAGSVATFRAEVANGGTLPADGDVNVVLNSPYNGAVATGQDWVCTSNLYCVHGGPVAPGERLSPLNVSVPVPADAAPSVLSAGVTVSGDGDRVTTNNGSDLSTGIERKLEVRRASLYDGEAQRSRLPLGGKTAVQIQFADGIDPQNGQLSAFLPTGVALGDEAPTGLAHATRETVSGGEKVTWDLASGGESSTRSFTVSADSGATPGSRTIELSLTSELTAQPETDDAPLTIVRPTLTSATPQTISKSLDQTLTVAGTDLDPSHRLVVRTGSASITGTGDATTASAKTAVFDLRSLGEGPATVALVDRSGNELTTLSKQISVVDPEYRDPEVSVVVPPRVRINTEAFAYVSVTNPSNVDIQSVPLIVTAPPGVEMRPDGSGGRELIAKAVEDMARPEVPSEFRLSEIDRDEIIQNLENEIPVEEDPETGGMRSIVVMPSIPAGGTARLRVGLLPRVEVTAPVRAMVPVDRDVFEQTGEVTDFAARFLAQAASPSTARRIVAKAKPRIEGEIIDCRGMDPVACEDVRRTTRMYQAGIQGTRRIAQENACTSFSGITFGVIGSDCQFDLTAPIKSMVKKKFPPLGWIDSIKSGFDLYGDLSDAADSVKSAGEPTQFGVQSVDPNDKLSPSGYGEGRWITGDDPITYTIRFENVRSATAAAQQVRVTDVLPDELDADSVRIVGAEIGGVQVPMTVSSSESGKSATGSAVLDQDTGRDVLLDVDLDVPEHTLVAVFRGSADLDDPFTPTAFGDFLPPNDDDRAGEGSITLTAQADDDLETGAEVVNEASIVFDPHADGPTIDTPPALNSIDRSAPSVTAPTGSYRVGDRIGFAASDEGSGVAKIEVTPVRAGVPQAKVVVDSSSRQFDSPKAAGEYQFVVRVTDGVGRATETASGPITVAPKPMPDTEAPDTVITDGPSGTIKTGSATFSFAGTPAADTAKLQCRLDGGAFSDCSSPKTFDGLGNGSHTVAFRAEDAAGNQDPTPATRTFQVDLGGTAPRAAIGKVKVVGPGRARKGRPTAYTVRVTNSGGVPAKGVKLAVSGKGVKGKKVIGGIGAKAAKAVKVKLRPAKAGKVKLTFKVSSANAGRKTARKTITVRR